MTALPTPAPGHVLVVDDAPESRRLLQLQLEAIGWRVVAVEGAQAALDWLAAHRPDALVTDIRMPRMSGEELVARLREAGGTLPRIVGYTAHADPQELRRIRAAGFDQVLTKPASMDDLERVLPPPES